MAQALTLNMTQQRSVWQTEQALLDPYRAEYQTRLALYRARQAYYFGTAYQDIPDLRKSLKLYAGVRQIFAPLARAVRVDVAKVPGDWRYADSVPADVRAVIDAVRLLSDHRREYAKFVLYGAVYGEYGVVVSADPAPRVHAVSPDRIIEGETETGEPFALVIAPSVATRNGRVERATLYTPSIVRRYENGEVVEETRNDLGIIPAFRGVYLTGLGDYGECAFSHAQEVLDRVNDLASQTLDVIQSQADPILAVSGVPKVAFEKGDNVLVLPPSEAKAYPLSPDLPIDQAVALLDRLIGEFKQLLPQLSLDLIQQRNDLAFDTVVVLLNEFVDYVISVRANVDSAVVRAERMAAQIGAARGLFPAVDVSLHALDARRNVFTLLNNGETE